MKISAFVFLLSFFIMTGCAASRTSAQRTKAELVHWFAENQQAVRFVGYQGSDQTQHHFIVRIMDSWTFVQVLKEELKLPDERPFASASSAQLYYYLVDPAHDFEKIGMKTTEANQTPERNDPSRHAGCYAPVAPAGVVAHP